MKSNMLTLLVATLAFLTTAPAMAENIDQQWVCAAKGLKTARYSGGSRAYVHLKSFRKGSDYAVTKNSDGSVSGKTANNTPFVCRPKA